MGHNWKIGTTIYPHIHFEQDNNAIPNFLIRYRWQMNGEAKTTAWTDYPLTTTAFTYTSGTLNQIVHSGGLTPPVGANLSDTIEFQIFRDNANNSGAFAGSDPYSGAVDLTFIDIHYEQDTLGSDSEFTK